MVNIKMNINDGWFYGGLNCFIEYTHKVPLLNTCTAEALPKTSTINLRNDKNLNFWLVYLSNVPFVNIGLSACSVALTRVTA